MSIDDVAKCRLKLRKLLEELGCTQFDLSTKLGLKPQTVPNYLNETKDRRPEPIVCLVIAGVCAAEDREFWIETSECSDLQLEAIARGLEIPRAVSAPLLSGVADMLAHPRNEPEKMLNQLIRSTVRTREEYLNKNKRKNS